MDGKPSKVYFVAFAMAHINNGLIVDHVVIRSEDNLHITQNFATGVYVNIIRGEGPDYTLAVAACEMALRRYSPPLYEKYLADREAGW